MAIKDRVARWWMHQRPRQGHDPGAQDVSTIQPGYEFYAMPNYRYEDQAKRPCYLPVYHRPQNPTKEEYGRAITNGWPCEEKRWHDKSAGPACWLPKGTPTQAGDWILVIDQVRGEELVDERGVKSDVWNVVLVPIEKATDWAEKHGCKQIERGKGRYYIGYACDLWLGNTGWHNIPNQYSPER